jgi:hypothetical protein
MWQPRPVRYVGNVVSSFALDLTLYDANGHQQLRQRKLPDRYGDLPLSASLA